MGIFASAAAWLRSRFGSTTASRRVRASDSLAIGQLPVWAQLGRIGGTITPEQVAQALARADQGEVGALVDLANDARRKDAHLQSILGTRELAASTLSWEFVVPEGRKGRRKAQKIAAWLTQAFQQAAGHVDPKDDDSDNLVGFRGLIKHLQGGVYHPFAISETLYERREGKLWPVAWSRLRQRRFRFDEQTGRLCWFDDSGGTPYPGIDLRATFAPGKLVIHQPDIVGDDPQREGLARVLIWSALFRNWTLRDVVALAELAWKPWRTGVYKKNSDPKDIAELYDAILELTSTGVGVFPETTELKVEWAKGGGSATQGPAHLQLLAWLGAEMSKAVLGQTLTTEQGARGSQALGRVHDRVRQDILEFDAMSLAATIQRDLIVPLVRMNFGRDAFVPTFRFLTEEVADLKLFGEGLVAIRKAGLKNIPASWVRDRTGVPEAKEGDEVLGDLEDDLAEGEVDIPIDEETGLPTEPGADTEDEGSDEEQGSETSAGDGAESEPEEDDPNRALLLAVRAMTASVERLLHRPPPAARSATPKDITP